jgi:hypothetical protein
MGYETNLPDEDAPTGLVFSSSLPRSMRWSIAAGLTVAGLLALGCGDDGSAGGGGAGSGGGVDFGGETAESGAIPDPGDHPADASQWTPPFEGNGTLATAYAVGVVSQEETYMALYVGETLEAFFVFRAGPDLEQLTVDLTGTPPESAVEWVHLHDGEGGVFGAKITPLAATAATGTWQVEADRVYVLEVRASGRGFV